MNKRNTELIFGSKVIHTKYNGEIGCSEILSAINDWNDLLNNNKEIKILVFDYIDATMIPLSSNDVIKIAEKTAVLTDTKKDLIMMGVMKKDLDAGLTHMWQAYSNIRSSIPDEQMHITRNLGDAFSKIDKIINA